MGLDCTQVETETFMQKPPDYKTMDSVHSVITIPYTTLPAPTTISDLPAEVIEYIIIRAAESGYVQAVALFAQTCRSFRELIYASSDYHLWREIFLLQFDDPRISASQEWDWGTHYRNRFKAAMLLRRLSSPSLSEEDTPIPIPIPEITDQLLSIIKTSLPLATTVSIDNPCSDSTSYLNSGDEQQLLQRPQPSYPIFPLPDRLDAVDPDGSSKNIKWMKTILGSRLPSHIAKEFIFSHNNALRTTERNRFYKMACCIGFSMVSEGVDGIAVDVDFHKRMRQWARKKVYDVRYLMSSRQWGPFLPATHQLSCIGRSHLIENHVFNDLFTLIQNHVLDMGAQEHDMASGFVALPRSEDMHVDWEYLFGIRNVVEANLRDVIVGGRADEVLKGLVSLDCLRACAAPGSWKKLPKEPPSSCTEGWDWAGVEGVWRRCICWMDYRDLILNNINASATRFSDSGLGEAIRILPVRMHIVSYSAALAAFPDRPTIHVEGEQGGPLSSSDIRQVHGTVRMTADGEVRYTLYTRKQGESEDEWVTEGIQVGNVGSATGILGMWTGAKHERSDPLGPFWAWKMA